MEPLIQEALARHATIADAYLHAERIGFQLQLLHGDIDVDGVDLTLVFDVTLRPLQLKSRRCGSGTHRWRVRRRIPMPSTHSSLHKTIFEGMEDVSTEGLGGALLVQELCFLREPPFLRVWYRLGMIQLVFLRDVDRFACFREESHRCPTHLTLKESDLTPCLTMAEVLWLLFHMGQDCDLAQGRAHPEAVLLSGVPDARERAAVALLSLERAAEERFQRWVAAARPSASLRE